MNDRHLARLDALQARLAADDIPGLLVTSEINVSYLTGFSGDSTPLIVLRDRVLAVTDGRFVTQLEGECAGLELHVRPVSQNLWAAVVEAVSRVSISRLAFEANRLVVASHDALREGLPTVALHGMIGLVEALRAVKDAGEIETTRRAVACAESAFLALTDGLDLSKDEVETAQALEHLMRTHGSHRPAFETIVASGPRSALPHAHPVQDSRITEQGFLLVDWGATVDGYRSDLTRIVRTGTVVEEFGEMYRAVVAAQRQAIAAIRPGRLAGEVDAEARKSLEAVGFGRLFGHGTGHGLGREIHESPWIRPHSEDVLRPGMILTIEPGVYRPGLGGVRIEDDVLVTPDGAEVLSSLPKDFEAVFA